MSVASYKQPKRGRGKPDAKLELELELELERRMKYETIWSGKEAQDLHAKKKSGRKTNEKEAALKELYKTGGDGTSKAGPISEKRKSGRKAGSKPRDHSIWLSDLFLWVSIVDCCLTDPRSGLKDAATAHKVSDSLLNKKVKDLGELTGLSLFEMESISKAGKPSKHRTGFLSAEGAFLGSVFAAMEHLWHFALTAKDRRSLTTANMEIAVVAHEIFTGLYSPIQRELEDAKYSQIHTEAARKARVGWRLPDRMSLNRTRKDEFQRLAQKHGTKAIKSHPYHLAPRRYLADGTPIYPVK
jgi:hypothetical protein